jgi:AcrR family transcriptional regulator
VVSEQTSTELADRLVQAGLAELDRTPASDLSVRRIAVHLGVSHQAPYVHFGSKRSYLAAVAGAGLAQAGVAASRAVEAAGPDPRRRAHALADAYIDFATRRAHLHDLAFGPMVAKSDHPDLQDAAITYWELLRAVTAANQPSDVAEGALLRRSTALWATIYGVSRLAAANQIPASVPGPSDDIIHDTLDLLLDSWSGSHERPSAEDA